MYQPYPITPLTKLNQDNGFLETIDFSPPGYEGAVKTHLSFVTSARSRMGCNVIKTFSIPVMYTGKMNYTDDQGNCLGCYFVNGKLHNETAPAWECVCIEGAHVFGYALEGISYGSSWDLSIEKQISFINHLNSLTK